MDDDRRFWRWAWFLTSVVLVGLVYAVAMVTWVVMRTPACE